MRLIYLGWDLDVYGQILLRMRLVYNSCMDKIMDFVFNGWHLCMDKCSMDEICVWMSVEWMILLLCITVYV
jgi:hypothetical protein